MCYKFKLQSKEFLRSEELLHACMHVVFLLVSYFSAFAHLSEKCPDLFSIPSVQVYIKLYMNGSPVHPNVAKNLFSVSNNTACS